MLLYRAKIFAALPGALLLTACASPLPPPSVKNGPADPQAAEAPPAPAAGSLQSYKSFARPMQDNPPAEGMSEMQGAARLDAGHESRVYAG